MKMSPTTSTRKVLLALGCALGFAIPSVPALQAADTVTLQPLADKGAALPVSYTFDKVTGGENGPYVLKVKNTSADTLKVSAKILLAVAFHADNKAKLVPEHAISAGDTWSIADLAAADKVILTATGFAPLEIVVP